MMKLMRSSYAIKSGALFVLITIFVTTHATESNAALEVLGPEGDVPLKRSLQAELGDSIIDKTNRCGLFDIFHLDFAAFKDAFVTGITTEKSCTICDHLVSTLRNLVTYLTPNEFHELGHVVCKHTKVFDRETCLGILETYGNDTYFIFNKTNVLRIDSQEICTLMLGHTCGLLVSEFHNWTIVLPETPNNLVKKAPSEQQTYSVLQVSDTHYDPEYSAGSVANCKGFLCCQKGHGNATDPNDAAGFWGDFRRCDLPLSTLQNVFEHLEKAHLKELGMVYWTGDLPPHSIWKSNHEDQQETFRVTSSLVRKHLKGLRVYPTVGNHEAIPPNLFVSLDKDVDDSTFKPYIMKTFHLYETLAHEWSSWLHSDVLEHFKRTGFYSTYVKPALKLISINTNYCYHLNFWLFVDSRDPGDQLAWLINELADAEAKGHSVHIIGHTPPGISDCMEVWSAQYHAIVTRFASTITGQFFGHTHYDEFIVFYDKKRNLPVNVAYVSPSVTTYGGVNPSYRIYEVSNSKIISHSTYAMNVSKANLNPNSEPEWVFEYKVPAAYGMKSLEPSEWDKVATRCQKDESFFERYYEHYIRRDITEKPCNETCRQHLVCRLKTDRSHDRSACEMLL